jgi:hypothetical protein
MYRSDHSTTRQRVSHWFRDRITLAYQFLFDAAQETGGRNKNIMSFMDNGVAESSTYQVRPQFEYHFFPIIYSESKRMADALIWTNGNAKYHGFWIQTQDYEFFALYQNTKWTPGIDYALPGESSYTTRANYDIADADIILLWDGTSFSFAKWTGTTIEAETPRLLAATA